MQKMNFSVTANGEAGTRRPIDNYAAPLALCSIWMIASAAALLGLRLAVESGAHTIGISGVLRSAALAFAFMLCAPLGLSLKALSRGWQAVAPVLLTVFLFLCVALFGRIAPVAVDLILFAVVMAGARTAFPSMRRSLSLPLLGFIGASALLLSAAHLTLLLLRGYAHPLGFEQALMGVLFKDTMFHAAIAGLFQQYGVASIGLDGLHPISYHIASHWLIGGLAEWTGTSSIQAYSLFVPIVAGPLLFFHFLSAVERLSPKDDNVGDFARTLAFSAISVAFGHYVFGSFWISESYLVSLWFLLLAIQLMSVGLPDNIVSAVPQLFGMAALVLLASLSKISTGAVLACGVAVWVAWHKPKSPIWILAGTIFGILPFLAVYVATFSKSEYGGESILRPLAYFQASGYKAAFLPVLAATLFLSIWQRFPKERPPQALLLALCTMMLAAIACGLTLFLPAGAVGYFVNPGVWAALCAMAAVAWPQKLLSRFRGKAQLAIPLAALAFIVLADGGTSTAWRNTDRLLKTIKAQSGGKGTQGLIESSLYGQILETVAQNPGIDGIQVAPGADRFWSGNKLCWTSSLSVQALAARPLLEGMHPTSSDCKLPTTTYGWPDYKRPESAARDHDDRSLCSAAEARNMKTILRVESDSKLRIVDCSAMRTASN